MKFNKYIFINFVLEGGPTFKQLFIIESILAIILQTYETKCFEKSLFGSGTSDGVLVF